MLFIGVHMRGWSPRLAKSLSQAIQGGILSIILTLKPFFKWILALIQHFILICFWMWPTTQNIILINNPLKVHLVFTVIAVNVTSVSSNVMDWPFGHEVWSSCWIALLLEGFDLSMRGFRLHLSVFVVLHIFEKHSIFTSLLFFGGFELFLKLLAEMTLFV